MKIAIPLDENRQDVCVTFGRAPFFLLSDNGKNEILENPGAEAQGGAGLQAAQFVVDQHADVLVTVRCGENAAQVFRAAGVEIYQSHGENALENVKQMVSGSLEKLTHFHKGFHGIR